MAGRFHSAWGVVLVAACAQPGPPAPCVPSASIASVEPAAVRLQCVAEDRVTLHGSGLAGATVRIGGAAIANARVTDAQIDAIAPRPDAAGEQPITLTDASGCAAEVAVRVNYVDELRVTDVFPGDVLVQVLTKVKACFNREIQTAPEGALKVTGRGVALPGTQTTEGRCVVLTLNEPVYVGGCSSVVGEIDTSLIRDLSGLGPCPGAHGSFSWSTLTRCCDCATPLVGFVTAGGGFSSSATHKLYSSFGAEPGMAEAVLQLTRGAR